MPVSKCSFSGDSVRFGVFKSRPRILKPGSRSLAVSQSPIYNSLPLSSIRFQREPRSNHLDLPSRFLQPVCRLLVTSVTYHYERPLWSWKCQSNLITECSSQKTDLLIKPNWDVALDPVNRDDNFFCQLIQVVLIWLDGKWIWWYLPQIQI